MSGSSKLQVWSLGKAVENKGDWLNQADFSLKIKPVEKTLGADSEVTSNAQETVVQGEDASGRAYFDKAVSADYIEALWLGEGQGNRVTPPDIRRGMEIIIYRLADSTHYYWELRNKDSGLANQETLVMAWSANEDDNDKSRTPENSYYLQIDTRRKLIALTTSQKLGEKTKYTLLLDPGNGRFILQDAQENQIAIDTTENAIVLGTANDAVVQLIKKHLNIVLPGDFKVITKGMVSVQADGVIGMESKKAIDLTAPNVNVNGNFSYSGNGTGKGSFTTDGAIASKTSVTAPNLR